MIDITINFSVDTPAILGYRVYYRILWSSGAYTLYPAVFSGPPATITLPAGLYEGYIVGECAPGEFTSPVYWQQTSLPTTTTTTTEFIPLNVSFVNLHPLVDTLTLSTQESTLVDEGLASSYYVTQYTYFTDNPDQATFVLNGVYVNFISSLTPVDYYITINSGINSQTIYGTASGSNFIISLPLVEYTEDVHIEFGATQTSLYISSIVDAADTINTVTYNSDRPIIYISGDGLPIGYQDIGLYTVVSNSQYESFDINLTTTQPSRWLRITKYDGSSYYVHIPSSGNQIVTLTDVPISTLNPLIIELVDFPISTTTTSTSTTSTTTTTTFCQDIVDIQGEGALGGP